jgi:hypothetical protein
VSGGARVFVDKAAQDGFSEDPSAVEVGNYEVATVVFTAGDSLGDLCVPRTLSTSCDQPVFVDHATDASVSPDVVSLKIDRFG